jgi:AraC-like DNA-binding protein
MCERALDFADDPAFALHWGEHACESTFAPLSHLIAHSADLGTALQTLFDYHRLVADEASYALVPDGDRLTLRLTKLLHPSARLRTFVVEMEAVGIYRMMRTFGVRPQLVSFGYPAPAYRDEYARIFKGSERFDAPHSGITFGRSSLSSVSPHKDDEIHRALQAIASRRVLRLTKRTPCALLVREHLVKQRMCIRPDMTQAAEALGVSARSLRRRLKAEGTSFYDVATKAATIIAKELLADMRKSIQEVAFEMGFADASGFHRAFKRWTGLTPSAYRDSW